MTKEDWDELLAHLTKLIIQKADEQVEGEFPSPQEIREKLSEFKSEEIRSGKKSFFAGAEIKT